MRARGRVRLADDGGVNRTDRLYAIVEELRAVSPKPVSARRLADRFEVSVRTVERDLSSLQESGVPVWAEPGRTGGYVIDADATLGPTGFTPDEALAVLVGLGTLRTGPFRLAARTAARKTLAVMPPEDSARAAALAARIHFLDDGRGPGADHLGTDRPPSVPTAFATALRADRVVRLRYQDQSWAESVRDVEPLGAIVKDGHWYLIAWCRLRDGVRAFRDDRVRSVDVTDERPARRTLRAEDLAIQYGTLRPVLDVD